MTSTGCGSGLRTYCVRPVAGIALVEGDRPLTGSKRTHSFGWVSPALPARLGLGFQMHGNHATFVADTASTAALLSSPGRRCRVMTGTRRRRR